MGNLDRLETGSNLNRVGADREGAERSRSPSLPVSKGVSLVTRNTSLDFDKFLFSTFAFTTRRQRNLDFFVGSLSVGRDQTVTDLLKDGRTSLKTERVGGGVGGSAGRSNELEKSNNRLTSAELSVRFCSKVRTFITPKRNRNTPLTASRTLSSPSCKCSKASCTSNHSFSFSPALTSLKSFFLLYILPRPSSPLTNGS